MNDKELLTSSSHRTKRSCTRQYYYEYELGLRTTKEKHYFRFGRNYHGGLECLNLGNPIEDACNLLAKNYASRPDYVSDFDWDLEHQTVTALVVGHNWAYSDDDLIVEYLAAEQTFTMPLINPETRAQSRTFMLAGKIDGIVRLNDGRIAVVEYKTASEDIDPTGKYWGRLRIDPQISMYILGARSLGFDVDTVLYDVCRKPTIRPRNIPLLDDDGLKVVTYDETGERVLKKDGKPRQTACEGATLATRIETPGEFSDRLLKDISERSENYYQRRELTRLTDDLGELQYDMWERAEQIRVCRRRGKWTQDSGRAVCDKCDYADICMQGIDVTQCVPDGFEKVDDVHPELSE